jgi:hypothetical protein
VLCRTVANEYWQQGWLAEPRPEDLAFIESLIRNADFGVRRLAVFALATFAKSQPRAAIALALQLDVGDSDKLAEELFATFKAGGIEADQLTDAELKGLLAKLEAIQGIDNYHIHQFLAYGAKRDPQGVLQLLLNRINREEKQDNTSWRALPYEGFHFPLEGWWSPTSIRTFCGRYVTVYSLRNEQTAFGSQSCSKKSP